MKYKQGDIVLVDYSFTDSSKSKVRPVVILSKNPGIPNKSYVVAKITSVIRQDNFSFIIHSTDIIGELIKTSEVRIHELSSVPANRIEKKIAYFKKEALKRLCESVVDNLWVE